jgi:hypothetical protein
LNDSPHEMIMLRCRTQRFIAKACGQVPEPEPPFHVKSFARCAAKGDGIHVFPGRRNQYKGRRRMIW